MLNKEQFLFYWSRLLDKKNGKVLLLLLLQNKGFIWTFIPNSKSNMFILRKFPFTLKIDKQTDGIETLQRLEIK